MDANKSSTMTIYDTDMKEFQEEAGEEMGLDMWTEWKVNEEIGSEWTVEK